MQVKVLKALRDPNSDNRLLALAVLTEGKRTTNWQWHSWNDAESRFSQPQQQ